MNTPKPSHDTPTPPSPAALSTRVAEVLVAAVLLVLGAIVVADSLRVGASWGDDGPRAGYFPFYIGIGLVAVSAAILLPQLLKWRGDRRIFVHRDEAAGVVAVLWPMVLMVVAMKWVGLYLASAALVAYFMRRHGKFGWLASAGTALGCVLAVYFTFERWFMVPLPKGPLEAWLGL